MRHSIKRIFSLATITAIAVSSTALLSTDAATISRSYVVYDYSTNQEVSSAAYTLTMEENAGGSTYTVFPPDDRVEYANSGIVSLGISTGDFGTGFIIGDHTIATAAHCVFNGESFVQNVEITLYDDNRNAVATIDPVEAHIPVVYRQSVDFRYDYALITVTEDLSSYEHFNFGELLVSAANSEDIPISVCGFPGDYPDGELMIATGDLLQVYDEYFKYDTDAVAGESGGPVFVTSTYTVGTNAPVEIKTVIGIHTYSATTFNQANRITPELLQFYNNNPYNTYEE